MIRMLFRMGQRLPNDWTEEELRENAEALEEAVTVPVNVEIEAEHRVLDLSQMEEILRRANRITLQDCGCRTLRGNCDAPLDVCIALDEAADLEGSSYNSREATLEEALEALGRSHDAGLVHMAYTIKGEDRPTIICSCCPCCCHTLGGLLRFGIATRVLSSRLVAEDDASKCTGCGACVKRCVFGARGIEDGKTVYDPGRCFGCGLCVSTCPNSAIRLLEKAET